jgi:hypothetical protein
MCEAPKGAALRGCPFCVRLVRHTGLLSERAWSDFTSATPLVTCDAAVQRSYLADSWRPAAASPQRQRQSQRQSPRHRSHHRPPFHRQATRSQASCSKALRTGDVRWQADLSITASRWVPESPGSRWTPTVGTPFRICPIALGSGSLPLQTILATAIWSSRVARMHPSMGIPCETSSLFVPGRMASRTLHQRCTVSCITRQLKDGDPLRTRGFCISAMPKVHSTCTRRLTPMGVTKSVAFRSVPDFSAPVTATTRSCRHQLRSAVT